MASLEVDNVFSGYGSMEVLHGVSLVAEANQIVTIIGPNGSGKSTLLKTILGYLIPTAGTIQFEEEDVTKLKPNKKVVLGIAYVPQLEGTFPSLTIQENLEMGGYSIDSKKTKQGIENAFATFPVLKEKRRKRAHTLSGGQRQMLAMGRALMTEPRLILLDEPSAGLAPNAAGAVFTNIERMHKEERTTIIIVEQDAQRSLSISDRGYVVAMGQNEFDGSADQILNNSQIRKAYLGG